MPSSTYPRTSIPGDSRHMSQLARVWKTTYMSDYAGLALLGIGLGLLATFVTPFHRMFSVNDLAISFPHAEHERVPTSWAIIAALIFPLLVFVCHGCRFGHSQALYLSFTVAIMLTGFLTEVVKDAVGRPRPDLLARCRLKKDAKLDGLVTIEVCDLPHDRKLHEGWRSFPSGHSSFSFAGLGFLSLFFAGQLHLFSQAGNRDLCRTLLCLSPLIGAMLIAISRCEDYRHDVYDVCCGSALGMFIAYWSYRRHWPKLSSPKCDVPLPPPGSDTREWQRIGDEEMGDPGSERGYELGDLARTRSRQPR
ncbi:putative DPP1-diacylglycerol pyrophosphate phosphatase [Ophiocordyceps camponoti-floridani]|uniref:Putative DPP1-diacylglycerol pyrophosphate phosphatase n=1 Tax=Ophiocordyceps camponoti-floridani TaxID=2030778 RepID=A0A8H4QDV3_9HYPO|nr:putative DPP1-diacylglycerol pyrophosphate phosphatase [Ophiocordyceps camponoti-floridani]